MLLTSVLKNNRFLLAHLWFYLSIKELESKAYI